MTFEPAVVATEPTKPSIVNAPLRNYAAGLLVYGLGLLFALSVPYYGWTLYRPTEIVLTAIYIGYALLGIPFFFLSGRAAPEGTPLLALRALWRVVSGTGAALARKRPWTFEISRVGHEEKVALLFLGVKIFFLPMMVNFFFGNWSATRSFVDRALAGDWDAIYFFLIAGIALVDVAYFVVSYTLDFHSLGNKIRTVEPTFLGWAVALVCYPPLNGYMAHFVEWHATDGVQFPTPTFEIAGRTAIVALFLVYLSATLALGFKASNLTNRGIVSRGPYRFIRHPAYATKCAAWWVMILPVWSVPAVVGMLVWTGIYGMRALTEERHLMLDPDYRAYCEKVRWRFIPGVV